MEGEQIQKYLELLFSDMPNNEESEFRFIGNDLPTKTFFGFPDDYTIENSQDKGYNVFVGIFSRLNRKPNSTSALWVDIDFKDRIPNLLPIKTSVVLDLQMSGIPPSFLVHSGHGIHAYWMLKERLYDTEVAKSVLKRLATHFNADRCYDVARILRVPGTLNLKNREKPAPVVLQTNSTIRRYPIEEITSTVVNVPSIPEKIDHIIETGDISMFEDRSSADYAVVKELIKIGYDFDEIEGIYQTQPIGLKGKYYEKDSNRSGAGGEYLRYTYNAASRSFSR